jgi:hypothetical protein
MYMSEYRNQVDTLSKAELVSAAKQLGASRRFIRFLELAKQDTMIHEWFSAEVSTMESTRPSQSVKDKISPRYEMYDYFTETQQFCQQRNVNREGLAHFWDGNVEQAYELLFDYDTISELERIYSPETLQQ